LAIAVAAYFGFVRPAQQHMLSLERQCSKLVVAVKKLQSNDESARHGLRLIESLETQAGKLAAAESALDRLADLNRRLVEQANNVTAATTALAKLETVQGDIERHGVALSNTAETLESVSESTAAISTSIAASGDTARKASGSLAMLGEQQVDLAEGIAALSHQLSSLESAVVTRGDSLPQAEQVLAQVDALFEKLGGEAGNLADAQTHLDQLAGLKQEVLDSAADVPAAAAVLDQVWDLQEGLLQATSTISKARKLTVDMMLLEPVLDRVAKSLQPMSDATRLSRREEAKAAPRTRRTATADEPVSPWSSAINVFVALLNSDD